jgi:hypothetical protein
VGGESETEAETERAERQRRSERTSGALSQDSVVYEEGMIGSELYFVIMGEVCSVCPSSWARSCLPSKARPHRDSTQHLSQI